MPAPPDSLNEEARARWLAVAPILATRGPVDVGLLRTYCTTWARWQETERGITTAGALMRNARGGVVASPLLAVSNQAAAQVRQLAKALRLEHSEPDDDLEVLTWPRVDRSQLAEACGVHRGTISEWTAQGLPVLRPGGNGRQARYDLVACLAWVRDRQAAAVARTSETDAARARRDNAQAEEAEQRILLRAGTLVHREEVARAWMAEIAAVRAMLLHLPATVADRVYRIGRTEGPNGIEAELDHAVKAALLELGDPQRPASRADHQTLRRRARTTTTRTRHPQPAAPAIATPTEE